MHLSSDKKDPSFLLDIHSESLQSCHDRYPHISMENCYSHWHCFHNFSPHNHSHRCKSNWKDFCLKNQPFKIWKFQVVIVLPSSFIGTCRTVETWRMGTFVHIFTTKSSTPSVRTLTVIRVQTINTFSTVLAQVTLAIINVDLTIVTRKAFK